MKKINKIILLLMVFVMIFAFAGCTDGKDNKNQTESLILEELSDEQSLSILNNATINYLNINNQIITSYGTETDSRGYTKTTNMELHHNNDNGIPTVYALIAETSEETINKVKKTNEMQLEYTCLKEKDLFYIYCGYLDKQLTNDELTSFRKNNEYMTPTEVEYNDFIQVEMNELISDLSETFRTLVEEVKPKEITGTKDNNGIINLKINMTRKIEKATYIDKYDIDIKDEKIISMNHQGTAINGKDKYIIDYNFKVDYIKKKVVVKDKDSYIKADSKSEI